MWIYLQLQKDELFTLQLLLLLLLISLKLVIKFLINLFEKNMSFMRKIYAIDKILFK